MSLSALRPALPPTFNIPHLCPVNQTCVCYPPLHLVLSSDRLVTMLFVYSALGELPLHFPCSKAHYQSCHFSAQKLSFNKDVKALRQESSRMSFSPVLHPSFQLSCPVCPQLDWVIGGSLVGVMGSSKHHTHFKLLPILASVYGIPSSAVVICLPNPTVSLTQQSFLVTTLLIIVHLEEGLENCGPTGLLCL